LGKTPDARNNDGVVPTLSQLYGDLIAVTRADHGDVIGHYGGAGTLDLLVSGSGFRRKHLQQVWQAIGAYLTSG